MYVSAPAWRGTSAVSRLRSAKRIRGLGDLPLCATLKLPPGFVGPVECDSSAGGPQYFPSVSQVSGLQDQINELWETIAGGGAAPASSTFTEWLNANGSTVAVVGGSAIGLLILAKVFRG